jgi:PQQ-dependent catabolism-associated CXXCW motif protein
MIGQGGRIAVALVAFVSTAAAQSDVPEPESYRMRDYRAATPATLRGATIVNTSEAERLWRGHDAAFVDVLPQAPRPKTLPPGTIWRDKPHADVPGSLWLADSGYGELAPSMLEYFSRGLEKATNGDHDRTVVIYCLADCWMSWNAAKRALTLGFKHVDWYRDGADGWTSAGLPTEDAKPEQRLDP